ncbi:HlyC/CorC family transporter [Peloplasma aerotolerans]|uniref:Hemolysin family protein n=1 Tax=Peloplasma aerotolerans TaxID=3044389 RepID=A0AAW6U8K0_9MOLU|nr:hemolysin family protein [Mariniplasma sp. M4Ah]MDI6452019.1 hemolysin family protein [Mariniplasma sp. M4Ah]
MGKEEFIKIGILAVLILLSSFFSATETAFSSLNPIKLKHRIQNKEHRANKTLALTYDFEKVLTTILIGNNIVNIAAASLATVLFVQYWGNAGVTISTAVMTTLVLIFGEITPKSIAKKMPEQFAIAVTPILVFFIYLLMPLNLIFGLIQKLMNKWFKFKKEPAITEDELLTYVSEVQQEGGINENEGELIRSVIDFDDLKVEDIFTPRVKVIAVNEKDDYKKITHAFKHSGYSRLPVYGTNIDHIVGTINHKDYYNKVLIDKEPLDSIIKPPVFVTEYMRVTNLLEMLKEHKSHMAIVKDEFGGTLGVVTMEDILEEIVGDIWDEHDEIVEQINEIDENNYRVKGTADLEDVFEQLHIDEDEDELEYSTVNGWVLDELGRIPVIGDMFEYKNFKITVTSADTKRVLEVNIEVLPKTKENMEE